MIKLFLFVAVVSSMISYINMDPMKSSFFLIFSLLSIMPVVTFSNHVWFSYFICLLFLSGIFVILVYFSSLSSISVSKGKMWFLVLVLSLLLEMNYVFLGNKLSLSMFYYNINLLIFIMILMSLIFFMNFSSYFLSFSGALRKV